MFSPLDQFSNERVREWSVCVVGFYSYQLARRVVYNVYTYVTRVFFICTQRITYSLLICASKLAYLRSWRQRFIFLSLMFGLLFVELVDTITIAICLLDPTVMSMDQAAKWTSKKREVLQAVMLSSPKTVISTVNFAIIVVSQTPVWRCLSLRDQATRNYNQLVTRAMQPQGPVVTNTREHNRLLSFSKHMAY